MKRFVTLLLLTISLNAFCQETKEEINISSAYSSKLVFKEIKKEVKKRSQKNYEITIIVFSYFFEGYIYIHGKVLPIVDINGQLFAFKNEKEALKFIKEFLKKKENSL